MLLIAAIFATVALVSADSSSSSSCTVSVPTVISSITYLPSSIETAIATAYTQAADVTSIGSIISTIALTSPSITYAEDVIASYEQSYSTIISYISEIDASPSLLPASSVSSFSSLESIHSTLASAISTVVYIEDTQSSLAAVQTVLESIEVSQPSILGYLTEYTYVASPTLYYDTESIEAATVTSPSIFGTVVDVTSAIYSYPSISSDVYSLSSEVYSIPSTVVTEIVSYISSPSIVSPSIVSSLESCYPSVYTQVTSIVEFTYSHPSVVTAMTDAIYAESSVSSLLTDVSYVISVEFPTLSYQESVMSSIYYVSPFIGSYISYVAYWEAVSPTFSDAMSTMEETFYESSSVATLIYDALMSPSTVTQPSVVSYAMLSHQSFVSAVTELISFESAYASSASTISSIVSALTDVFVSYGTVLTAAEYVMDMTSSSEVTVSSGISSLLDVVSSITTVLYHVYDAVYYSPSLSCYEEAIESYAWDYPYYVSSLFEVYNSPSLITSSFSYYSYLEDEYSTVAYAISELVSAEVNYSSLSYAEGEFISAAEFDSGLLSQAEQFFTWGSSVSIDWSDYYSS